MKLRPIHIILAGFFLLTLTATQCEKEEPTLPPETQIGADTFGCYINGVLVVPSKPPNMQTTSKTPGLMVDYQPEINQFSIECYYGDLSILFTVDNPRENEYLPFSVLRFTSTGVVCISPHPICNLPNANGHVFFTRFDTIRGIASGRFEFSGDCVQYYYGGMHDTLKIQITSGRFDVGIRTVIR